jgi:hypothetical protein
MSIGQQTSIEDNRNRHFGLDTSSNMIMEAEIDT